MVSLESTMRRAEILCFESRVIDQQCYHVDREPGSVTLIVQSRISGHIYVVSVLASLSVGGGTVPSTYRHDPFQACSHICYQLPVMEGNTSCRCYMRVPKRGSEISLNFLDVQLSREIMLPRCAGRGGEGGGTLWEEESAFHNPLATMTMARGKHHSTLCHHLGHHDGDHFDDYNDD